MIDVTDLTKRYGPTLAVDRLSFSVAPGRVTGFLGPNGAGKSTTLRVVLGLDRASGGRATVDGRPYRELPVPLRVVGALLDATAVHGGRTAAAHLLGLARSNALPRRRVDEVLDLVGLTAVAGRRPVGSRWACTSGWASPPRCSVTPRCCCSTNRSTGSTPRAFAGCGRCCGGSRPRDGRCCSPAIS